MPQESCADWGDERVTLQRHHPFLTVDKRTDRQTNSPISIRCSNSHNVVGRTVHKEDEHWQNSEETYYPLHERHTTCFRLGEVDYESTYNHS